MFEIHITVVCPWRDLESFRETCRELGVKSLVITLGGDVSQYHVMTSSVFYGSFTEMLVELQRICDGLSDYKIIRQKVETSPRMAEQLKQIITPLYYEVHVEVDNHLLSNLPLDLECSWYVSNNINKPNYTILTCRQICWDDRLAIERDYNSLISNQVLLDGVKGLLYEFAILDTNPELDSTWIIK